MKFFIDKHGHWQWEK